MKKKSKRQDSSSDANKDAIDNLLEMLFRQARAQFGDAIQSFWFYDGDLCPACARRPIEVIKYKGQDSLALNAFIYRPRGILIGYFLCETCALQIFDAAQKNPYRQTPLHTDIERNLIAAYHKYIASFD